MSTSTKQADISLHYNISIEPALRRIAVTLKIKGAKEKLVLTMRESSGPQTDFLSNVKMLQVFDSQGHQIPIEREKNRWMIQNVSPEMTLSYLIQPKHDKLISWEPTLNDDYCLLFGYAVLIYPELDLNQELFCEVELNVPQHWPDITTWGYQERRYRVSTLSDLIESIIALGDYRLYHSTLQGKELTLAIRNQWPFSDREFLSWTENYLKHHAEVFGGLPFDCLTVICDKKQSRGGLGTIVGHGEKKSVICALINPESETSNAMRLNHWMFSHELLHLWLGRAIQPQEVGVVWFQEGIPSYYAALSVCHLLSDTEAGSENRKAKASGFARLLREPLREANRFLESLREWHAKEKRITGLSLEKAASTFGGNDEKSYEVIYNKGPLVCWILDVEIRVATGNRKCLADLMKILYQRFGNQPKAYNNDDVFAIASELGNQDYDWIYKKYVLGTEPIPFENYLTKAFV